MDVQTEKLQLIEQLLRTNDMRVLAEIREILSKTINPVVGYEPDGTPITQQDFIRKIEKAEMEFAQGNYRTIEEFEKEVEKW